MTVAEIGALVKKMRKEQGLTQVQLAAVAGVGDRFVRELEQGKETCQWGKVLHVLSMLGLTVTIAGEH